MERSPYHRSSMYSRVLGTHGCPIPRVVMGTHGCPIPRVVMGTHGCPIPVNTRVEGCWVVPHCHSMILLTQTRHHQSLLDKLLMSPQVWHLDHAVLRVKN